MVYICRPTGSWTTSCMHSMASPLVWLCTLYVAVWSRIPEVEAIQCVTTTHPHFHLSQPVNNHHVGQIARQRGYDRGAPNGR